ncbi:MAG: hypothetical protein PHZ03_10825 [Syntrophomonas sp.]|nr:hypothetical protein [Syntrophomonas sp.]
MDMVKVEQLRDEVIGLRPVYCDIGNATDILLKSGEVVRDRRILKSVVKALAASYAIDLKAQRKLLQEKISRKGVLPFYLGTGRVFVPLKMRQAVTDSDSVYGYVDMTYMGEPQAGVGKKCLIELSNGLRLQVLSSQSTVHGAQHYGKAVLAVFQPYKGGDDQQEQVMEAGRLFTCVIAQIVQQLNRIEQGLHRKD